MSATPEARKAVHSELAAELNHELSRYARLLHVLKSTMASLVPEGLDMAAFSLLLTLVKCGPRRQGELAELSLLDPSTVSRHVAQLARAGYVERRPDPQDGRAVHIVATPDGVQVAERIGERREAMIAQALAGWQPDDIRRLSALLARLNDDLDAFRPHIVSLMVGPPAPLQSTPTDQLPDPRTPDQEIV